MRPKKIVGCETRLPDPGEKMTVGLASYDPAFEVYGTISFDMQFIMSDDTHKVFTVSAVIIESHTDQINLSITWLKNNNITLIS